MMMKKNNTKYLLFGIILILFALFTTGVFASPIDNVNIDFEKEYYSVIEGNSLKIVYTIDNNNPTDVDLLIYASCDQDELTCNYSKSFNLVKNSKLTTSLTVISKDSGRSVLRLYVIDKKTNEETYYNLNINSDDDLEDGDFEIDIDRTSFCKGESVTNYILIDRVLYSGLYNLSLTSQTISSDLKIINPIYLNRNDNKIPFLISIPKDQQEGNYDFKLKIYNEKVNVLKNFSIYVSECKEIISSDLQVSSPSITNYTLYKEEPKTLIFTLKNKSLSKKKDFFISYNKDSPLTVKFSNKQINLSPGESKEIEVTVLASKDVLAGDYELNLSFFDELGVINKKYIFKVQPAYNFNAYLLKNFASLEIGDVINTKLILENLGDIKDTIDIKYYTQNNLNVIISSKNISLNPQEKKEIDLMISAGLYTVPKSSVIRFTLKGRNSDFYKEIVLDVSLFYKASELNISVLSFPKELDLYKNSKKDFSFEIINNRAVKTKIMNIEFYANELEKNIVFEFPKDFYLESKESKVILSNILVPDLPTQTINGSVVFYGDRGEVLTIPLTLNIIEEEEVVSKKNILGGFLNLGSSIFLGLIFLALLLILLYSTGVIKHKNYQRF